MLAATTPTGPPTWEPPHAKGMALKRQKEKKEKKNLSTTYSSSTISVNWHLNHPGITQWVQLPIVIPFSYEIRV